jgi:glycosyltransferase involved in cell wall biosynthesis
MTRIGWLADQAGAFWGGAELSSDELVRAAPPSVEIVACPPEAIEEDVDAYVVMNCVSYDASCIPALSRRPVIRSVRDQWPIGDDAVREWMLCNARLTIFNSLPHLKWFAWPVATPTAYVPPPIDVAKFRVAAAKATHREGTIWIGGFHRNKGIFEAVAWANNKKAEVHFYGAGTWRPWPTKYVRLMGLVNYEDVPDLMARHRSFLYISRSVESFGRTIAEAWASGLELMVEGITGATWWIKHEPAALEHGAEKFWDLTLNAIS